jgi:hypothetical protein
MQVRSSECVRADDVDPRAAPQETASAADGSEGFTPPPYDELAETSARGAFSDRVAAGGPPPYADALDGDDSDVDSPSPPEYDFYAEGDSDGATQLELLEDLPTLEEERGDPARAAHHAALRAASLRGDAAAVEAELERMRAKGLAPGALARHAAVFVHAKAGDAEGALAAAKAAVTVRIDAWRLTTACGSSRQALAAQLRSLLVQLCTVR